MKKYFILLLTAILWSIAAKAQSTSIPLQASKSSLQLKNNSNKGFELFISHNEIKSLTVSSEKGNFSEIHIPGNGHTGDAGTPKLPACTHLIEVPQGAEISVKVKNYDLAEYRLQDYGIENPIMPVQPSIRKDQDPNKLKFHYKKEAYTAKSFTNYEIAKTTVLGNMRGIRIAKLSVQPVNYNPSRGSLKVYNNIELEVNFKNSDTLSDKRMKRTGYSPYFEPVYSKLLNHKSITDEHPDLTKYPVKMLILADRMFEDALQPYVQWKTKKGFEVIVNYTDEGYNTPDAIKNWVQTHYESSGPDDPAPSFCLLVGDTDQIPASQVANQSDRKTDLYYFSQDGDYFPEMYYGRFSANNLQELQPQIDKTLYYEQYQFSDPTFLDDVTLIAGADGTWNPNVGQSTVQYGTDNYFNSSFGFANVNDYLDSYAGCYDNERIAVSLINYTAHCSQGGWGDPYFSISNAYNTNNTGKYPLAIGNCCLSADFGYSGECIGEAWVRAENGAVAYIGSSPSTYWFEDFYWAVGAFPIVGDNNGYVPTAEETTLGVYDAMFLSDYTSVGATIFLGNLAVTEVDVEGYPQHSNPEYYWEAYNALGDPSLIPFRTQASKNNVVHAGTIYLGSIHFEVSAEPGSYIALSKDGILYGTALTDESGTVKVPLQEVSEEGNMDIVVSKPQYQAYTAEICISKSQTPYIVSESYISEINYAQSADLFLSLKNAGMQTALGVEAEISSDESAEINNSYFSYGDIAGETVSDASPEGIFTITPARALPDGYQIPINIRITDSENTLWEYPMKLQVNAPEISVSPPFITNDDNNNWRLDPGETGDLIYTINNTGNAAADFSASLKITDNPDNSLELLQTSAGTLSIPAGESREFTFPDVSADIETLAGTKIGLQITVSAGSSGHYSSTVSHEITIGEAPEYLISSEGTLEVCVGNFYDSGGPEQAYSNSENYEMTFLPQQAGKMLQLQFTDLRIEPDTDNGGCYDQLSVYNGSSVSAPLIGSFCGNSVPEVLQNISASNPEGALTFVFSSDIYITDNGWCAEIACKENYAVTFDVSSNNSPVENAEIFFVHQNKTTDAQGRATFNYAAEGNHSYTVNAKGKKEFSGNVNVNQNQEETVVLSETDLALPPNNSQKFSLYPNPCRGITRVNLPTKKNWHIRIYNMAGQIVYETKGDKTRLIKLRNLSPGVYPVQAKTEDAVYHKKLIIQ